MEDFRRQVRECQYHYVGRTTCGCCVAVTYDLGDDDTAESVAGFIRSGLTIQRVDRVQYRAISAETTFMACPHAKAQP